MNRWVLSDSHFGHRNIIKYCSRPFSSAEEMDEVMISNWNELIHPEDIVYHLGDFCLGREDCAYYGDRLNGKKILLQGNHDRIKNGYKAVFSEIHYQLEIPGVIMAHHKIYNWDRKLIHLYGHCHGTGNRTPRSMDVGVDTNNFYPYNLDELIEKLSRE